MFYHINAEELFSLYTAWLPEVILQYKFFHVRPVIYSLHLQPSQSLEPVPGKELRSNLSQSLYHPV